MKFKFFQFLTILLVTFVSAQEKFDNAAIQKIKNEGLNNSQVEQIAFEIIDKSGSRLTNSEGYARAADYAVEQLTNWGLENAAKENWRH